MEGAFCNTSLWSSSYQRNNKGGGLKNLRCFPHCKETHVERGYCGAPVIIKLLQEDSLGQNSSKSLFALASFRESPVRRNTGKLPMPARDQGKNRSDACFQVGEKLELSRYRSLISENVLPKKFFKGDIQTSSVNMSGHNMKYTVAVFNVQNKGWNYSWHGTKHTSRMYHCLSVYVFQADRMVSENDEATLSCVGVFDSPTFTIHSRKKRKRDGDADNTCEESLQQAKRAVLPQAEYVSPNSIKQHCCSGNSCCEHKAPKAPLPSIFTATQDLSALTMLNSQVNALNALAQIELVKSIQQPQVLQQSQFPMLAPNYNNFGANFSPSLPLLEFQQLSSLYQRNFFR